MSSRKEKTQTEEGKPRVELVKPTSIRTAKFGLAEVIETSSLDGERKLFIWGGDVEVGNLTDSKVRSKVKLLLALIKVEKNIDAVIGLPQRLHPTPDDVGLYVEESRWDFTGRIVVSLKSKEDLSQEELLRFEEIFKKTEKLLPPIVTSS